MKKKIPLLILMIIVTDLFAFSYPEDFYFIDSQKKTRITIGSSLYYFQKQYGDSAEKDLIWSYSWTGYELWRYTYPDFIIETDNTSYMLRSFKTKNPAFYTSRNIHCGDTVEDAMKAYGTPTSNVNHCLMYVSIQKEINVLGENCLIYFVYNEDNVIQEMKICVDTDV